MHVRVKICGITNVEDALLAAELGADAIGLNFFQGSARCIALEKAAEICNELPPFVEPIALFVNESMPRIEATAKELGIKTVQIHADAHQPFDTYAVKWIPAFAVEEEADLVAIPALFKKWGLSEWSPYDPESCGDPDTPVLCHMPAAILVDAHVPGMHGGTGKTAPWHLLANFKPGVPMILAGGLTPENVAEAIRIAKPYAVDVASGVELSPGKKDADKMRRFIDAVRNAQ